MAERGLSSLWRDCVGAGRSPSPRERAGVKVAALPAPTQWRRRGPAAHGTKPLTLTLSRREGRRRPPPTQSRKRGQKRHVHYTRDQTYLAAVTTAAVPPALVTADRGVFRTAY